MNRHHYSLYVHNCRLVFLLRRDFTQVDTFRPAEFHWKLEQVRRRPLNKSHLSRFESFKTRSGRLSEDSERRWVFALLTVHMLSCDWLMKAAVRMKQPELSARICFKTYLMRKIVFFNLQTTRFWLELKVYYKSLPHTQIRFVGGFGGVFFSCANKKQVKRNREKRERHLSRFKGIYTFILCVKKWFVCV